MADVVEVMAKAIYDDAFTDGHVDEGEVSMKYCRSAAQAALSALDAAGYAVVPKEPQARIIAGVFVQTQDPSAADFAIARQAIVLLPSTPVEKVTESLADLSRDYRAMLSASQVSREADGKPS